MSGDVKMANHPSAIKRARQNVVRHARNSTVRSKLKTLIKKVNTFVEEKNVEEAKNVLLSTTRSLDKAVSKGIIHKKTASRKKSRLTKKVNSLAS